MTTQDSSYAPLSSTGRRPAGDAVDFTVMYAAHDAFQRDLDRLTAAARAARTTDPAVRAGWATLRNQLHIHHTAEDVSLWPALRQRVSAPAEIAVLDAMEAEHARIDPRLDRVDAALAAGDAEGLAASAAGLTAALAAHMEHEEHSALPLVAAHLGPAGWAAFGQEIRRSLGVRGGAEFFPWMLDGATTDTTRRVLGMLPRPARLLYRAVWRPAYARSRRWATG
jgi:iron-sulfur cluster repair protein YtfE (RIC family)